MPENILHVGVSVVVPVYRGAPTLRELCERVELALTPTNAPFEIILVDDGSPDESWKVIKDLASSHGVVRGLRLGRNYGQHAALLAGTRSATFSTTVTLDDDLQNPPEEIPRLLAALTQGDDVVYGVPSSVQQDFSRRLASRLARWSIKASGIEHAPSVSSFRAFRTDLRRSFNVPIGPAVDIDSLLTWGTTRFGSVKVAHAERKVGVSNYTLRRLLVHAFDFLTGYSALPLRIATFLGIAASGLGVVLLGWVLGHVLFAGDAVSGFPFVASTIIIFSGVQLVMLGLIGEYVGRIHFRSMGKPSYAILSSTDDVSETTD